MCLHRLQSESERADAAAAAVGAAEAAAARAEQRVTEAEQRAIEAEERGRQKGLAEGEEERGRLVQQVSWGDIVSDLCAQFIVLPNKSMQILLITTQIWCITHSLYAHTEHHTGAHAGVTAVRDPGAAGRAGEVQAGGG